ncbi:hypothetical protein RFI_22658, partial [Reticulomyxa filosa]
DIGDSSRDSKKLGIFRKSVCNGRIGHEDTDNRGGTTWLFQDSRNDDGPKQFILLKQKQVTDGIGFEDFFIMSFQCSRLTTADLLQRRWENAVAFRDKLKRTSASDRKFDEKEEKTAPSNAPGEIVAKVNRSAVLWLDEPSSAIEGLHKLLEEEDRKIGFIGLSNWRLDAAKVNRMVLHQTDTQFEFDFYGYRDFYSLASSLKYSCSVHNELTNDLLVDAVMQNFGGMTQQQTEAFLFTKLARFYYGGAMPKSEVIWNKFLPLHLMKHFRDVHSTIYLYQTIERVINVMSNGKLCILLKLEQLYDSLSMLSIKDTKPLKAVQSSQERKHLIETIIENVQNESIAIVTRMKEIQNVIYEDKYKNIIIGK